MSDRGIFLTWVYHDIAVKCCPVFWWAQSNIFWNVLLGRAFSNSFNGKGGWVQNVYLSTIPLTIDGTNTESQPAHHIINTILEQLQISQIYPNTHGMQQQRTHPKSAVQVPSSGPVVAFGSMRGTGNMDSVGDWMLHTQTQTLRLFCGAFPTEDHSCLQLQPNPNQPVDLSLRI